MTVSVWHWAGRQSVRWNRRHAVDVIDLYRDGFDPRMTDDERRHHHAVKTADSPRPPYAAQIRAATHLVLVFPALVVTHAGDPEGIFRPLLCAGRRIHPCGGLGPVHSAADRTQRVSVITTLGSPAWYHYLVLWQPVRRVLRHAVLRTCAPQARLGIRVLHDIERSTLAQREAFLAAARAGWRMTGMVDACTPLPHEPVSGHSCLL